MKLIKLNATDSTNNYLKQLSRNSVIDNFTVVTTTEQTNGKGQMGAIWKSEKGKNLTFSILIKNDLIESEQIFDLNVAVATAIIQVLETLEIPLLAIKWPNDILSGNKKIGGVLIENTFKYDKNIESVVGIGLNVNQTDFENLPKASSLHEIMKHEFDLETLLIRITERIQKNCTMIEQKKSHLLWKFYHDNLFKKDTEMSFTNDKNETFLGTINGVSKKGLLQISIKDKVIKTFAIKEIHMNF